MDAASRLNVDVVIFGGGCAGLWLLDDLRRRGACALLLEAGCLGSGQTGSAQGILHGGLKYSLAGLLSSSARMVREMPRIWEDSIHGRSEPDLSAVRSRADSCYLWRSRSLKAWTSMFGAVNALQVKPELLEEKLVPPLLARCPRPIYRLPERVIDPLSFLGVLAQRNRGLVWQVDARAGLHFERRTSTNAAPVISLRDARDDSVMELHAKSMILAAGEGNAGLRDQLGLPADAMQRRPLRVAFARGDLPKINGHCVDGVKTRVTLTSDVDTAGRTVWQLGGQLSEDGITLAPQDFLSQAKRELAAVLPGCDIEKIQWAQITVDRAERSTRDGLMPGDVQILRDGDILTVWPTKLVMAPLLSRRVMEMLEFERCPGNESWQRSIGEINWPAPAVARPPWDRELSWFNVG